MSPRFPYPVLLAGLLLILPAAPGLAPASNLHAAGEAGMELDLELSANRNVGFSPLSVSVTGKLHGIHGGNGNFCHPGVTWVLWNVDKDLFARSTSDPRCHHVKGRAYNPVVFKRSFTLGRGTHMARLIVQGKDGRMVSSDYVTIEVH
jgi:hypothetical protein